MGCTRWDAVGPPITRTRSGPQPTWGSRPRARIQPQCSWGGLQTPSPSSLPMQWSSSPQDSGQSWLLLPSPGKGPGCARSTRRRPSPRPHAPRPPCMGASRPCLVLTERAKRLQIPAPSTYFLHAGECVLQQVRVGQDLVGRRRRICVSAPCFMALESGRWRQTAAGSAWSPGPARPCRVSRTPRSEAVRDRDPPLGPDPWTPMTLGLPKCCPQEPAASPCTGRRVVDHAACPSPAPGWA